MLSNSEVLGLIIGSRIKNCTAWAVTFAEDYRDKTVTNIASVRKTHFDFAEKAEVQRVEYVKLIGGDPVGISVRDSCLSYLKAMMGTHAECYTQGIRRKFPDDVIEQATAVLDSYLEKQ